MKKFKEKEAAREARRLSALLESIGGEPLAGSGFEGEEADSEFGPAKLTAPLPGDSTR